MEKDSLVSIIVPTYNSEKFLEGCLESIKKQTYENIELVVVDNNSKDNTKEIAKKYTEKVFNKGPERSAQRNYGVKQAKGEYVIIIDSDMHLGEKVAEACVKEMQSDSKLKGLIIPEESFGEGFWAQCKKLERSFYVGVEWMEAARFFRKDVYELVGGYNEDLVSGEDWDLSQRIEKKGSLGRIEEYIFHNEGHPTLWGIVKKKYYYAGKFAQYTEVNKGAKNISRQTGIIGRYKLFFSDSKKLFKNPILGFGMLFMKTCEFGFGSGGYIMGKIKK